MGFSFEAVDALDHSVIVDLAAGTGKLSRRFDEVGIPVVAIEPAGNLRRVLKERLSTVRTVG